MMRIRVDPDRLLQLSQELQRVSHDLRSLSDRVAGAIGGLDWQVRSQANIDGRASAARQQGRSLSDQLGNLARFVTDRAQAFQEADRTSSLAVAAVIQTFPWQRYQRFLPPLIHILPFPFPHFPRIWIPPWRLPRWWPWIPWPPIIRIRPPRIPLPGWIRLPRPLPIIGIQPVLPAPIRLLPVLPIILPPLLWPRLPRILPWPPRIIFREPVISPPPWWRKGAMPRDDLVHALSAGEGAVGTKPESRPLEGNAKPESFDKETGCVEYAKARRPDLGAAGGGAANYIQNYQDTVQRVTDQDADLRTRIGEGYAVVWPAGHESLAGSAGQANGHVAIVEEVGPDYVVVSQAGWGEKTHMRLTREELTSLYLIP